MKIIAVVVILWVIGSIHTAAVTGGLVMVNRAISPGAKRRYVIFGGPAIWLVFLCVGIAAMTMSAAYRWRNRHVEKGQG